MKEITLFVSIILISANVAFGQNWLTDFSEAKEVASEDHRKIVLVFQGSDWCAPCKKMDRKIWKSKEFISYAASNLVLLKADFPRKKKNKLSKEQQEKNKQLAEKYNKYGYFPFVVVMDENGNVIGETAYEKISPKKYIEKISSF